MFRDYLGVKEAHSFKDLVSRCNLTLTLRKNTWPQGSIDDQGTSDPLGHWKMMLFGIKKNEISLFGPDLVLILP